MDPLIASSLSASSLVAVDVVGAIRESDLVGIVSTIALVIASIYVVTLILKKWRQYGVVALQNKGFLLACQRDGSLESAYAEAGLYPRSTLARVLKDAYFEVYHHNWFREFPGLALDQRLSIGKQWVERATDRAINEEIAKLESDLIHIGTISTLCPFIGLFGTVWGILAAFQALASANNASMQALAPGISTALITTIGGLCPAIIAVFFYNLFQNRVQGMAGEMEGYALDLQAIIQREIIRRNPNERAAA